VALGKVPPKKANTSRNIGIALRQFDKQIGLPPKPEDPAEAENPYPVSTGSGVRSIEQILDHTGGGSPMTGGWRHVTAQAIGPVGKAFQALGMGLSYASSYLKETIDFYQGEGWDKGDFYEQAKSGYTFGRLLHDEDWMQGGKWEEKWGAGWWLRGTISFTGDVILDPLTYVGLVGKGVAAGNLILKGGRLGGGQLAVHSLRKHLVDSAADGLQSFAMRHGAMALDDSIMGRLAQTLGDSRFLKNTKETLGYDAKHMFRQRKNGDWIVNLDAMGGIKPKVVGGKSVLDDAVKNPLLVDVTDELVLIPKSLVDDVQALYKMEGVAGLSGFTDDQIQLAAKHMDLVGMDKNGLPLLDYMGELKIRQSGQKVVGSDDIALSPRHKGTLFDDAIDAANTKIAAGVKIPLAGPIGRALKIPWAAGKGYPASLKIMRVPFSTRVIGPALQAVPKTARKIAFGTKEIGYGRGLIGWLRTGGRMQGMRKLARDGSASAVQRHQARAALSAAGRGQWKGRVVRNQMMHYANRFIKELNAHTLVDESGKKLKGDEVHRIYYAALGGDPEALKIIHGGVETSYDTITDEVLLSGIDTFNQIRKIANNGAGTEFVGEVPYYVPRILNEEAREYINKSSRTSTDVLRKGRETSAATQHELSRKLISDTEFDKLVEAKMAKGKTKATAIWELGQEGYTKGFMGYELYDVGTALPDDHVWRRSNRATSGKAPSIEKQIAFIMEDMGVGYSLFDDHIGRSLTAYVDGLSKRTGDVFTEEVLKRKGVFVDRIASMTSFPTAEMDVLTQEVHQLARNIEQAQQKLVQLQGDVDSYKSRGIDKIDSIAEASGIEADLLLKQQQLDDAKKVFEENVQLYNQKTDKLEAITAKHLAEEEKLDSLEKQLFDLNTQSEDTRRELATLANSDLNNLVRLQRKMERIEELIIKVKGDGMRLKVHARTMRAGTRQLIRLKQLLSSITGSKENFDIYRQVLGKYDPSAHRNIDEFITESLKDSVNEEGIGEAFNGLVRSKGLVGTVSDETPNGYQWEIVFPDGSVKTNVEVNVDLMKMVTVADNLDETAFGHKIAIDLQINETMDNLMVNPIAQFDNMFAHIEREVATSQQVIQEVETVIGREGIADEILGAVPTVENVEAAQATILRKIDESVAMSGKNPMNARVSDALKRDPEFKEAILTYYGTMGNDLTIKKAESGTQIQASIKQIENKLYDQLAVYQYPLEVEPVIPPMMVELNYPNGQTRTVELGLRDYVALIDADEAWRSQMSALSSDNLSNVTNILQNGRVIQASSAARGKGVTPTAKLNNRIQAVQGGTNVGFHIRANIDGDDVDFYIKRYDPNMEQGDTGAVFSEYGHTTADVARNRVQSEVLADALYREMDKFQTGNSVSRAAPDSWASSTDSSAPDFLRQQDNAGDFMVGDMLQNGQWKVAKFNDGIDFPNGSVPISEVKVILYENGSVALANGAEAAEAARRLPNVVGVENFTDRIKKQMLMDILTSNSDVIGYSGDNVGINRVTGAVIRIDNGASFHYRAQGLSKQNTQGFKWNEVDELEKADGSMGTFFSPEFENQPSQWQTFFRNELEKGDSFWGELGVQFETINNMRSGFGGWEPFVIKTLGTDATPQDIKMFTDWLEVRTKGIREIIERHTGSAPPLLEGDDLLKAQLASGFDPQTIKQIVEPPHSNVQQTSKKEGLRSWISNDGETQAIQAYPVKEAMEKAGEGRKLTTADKEGILRDRMVLKEYERWANDPKNYPAVAAMEYDDVSSAYHSTDLDWQRSLFEEDAQDLVIEKAMADESMGSPFGSVSELDEFEAQQQIMGQWDDDIQELMPWDDTSQTQFSLYDDPPTGRNEYEAWVNSAPERAEELQSQALWSGSMTDTVTPDGRSIRYGAVVVDQNGNVIMRMPTDSVNTGEPFGGVKWTLAKGGMDVGESPIETAMREISEELNIRATIYGALPEVEEQTTNSVSRYFVAKVDVGTPPIDKIPSSVKDTQERLFFYARHGYGGKSVVRAKDFAGTQNVPRSSWQDSQWINSTQADQYYFDKKSQTFGDSDSVYKVETPRGSEGIRVLGLPPVDQVTAAKQTIMDADPYGALSKEKFDNYIDVHRELDGQIIEGMGTNTENVQGAARFFTSMEVGKDFAPNRQTAWRDHELLLLEYTYRDADGESLDKLIYYLRNGDTELPTSDVKLTPEQEKLASIFSGEESLNHKNARLNLAAETLETMKVLDGRNIPEWDQLGFNEKLAFIGYLELQGGNALPWEQIYFGRAKGAALSEEEIAFLVATAPVGSGLDTASTALTPQVGSSAFAGNRQPTKTTTDYFTEGLFRDPTKRSPYGTGVEKLDPYYNWHSHNAVVTDPTTGAQVTQGYTPDVVAPSNVGKQPAGGTAAAMGYGFPEQMANIRFQNDRRSAVDFAQSIDAHISDPEHWNNIPVGDAYANNAIASHSSDFYIENQEFIDRMVARIAEVRSGGKPFTKKELAEYRAWVLSDVMNKIETHREGLVRLQSASERSIKEDLAFFNALNSDKQLGYLNQELGLNSPIIKNLVGGDYGSYKRSYEVPASEYAGGTIMDIPRFSLEGVDPKALRKEIVEKLKTGTPEQQEALMAEMGLDVSVAKGRPDWDKLVEKHFEEVSTLFRMGTATRTGNTQPIYNQLTSYINSAMVYRANTDYYRYAPFQHESVMSYLQKGRVSDYESKITPYKPQVTQTPSSMFDPRTGRRVTPQGQQFQELIGRAQAPTERVSAAAPAGGENFLSGSPAPSYPFVRQDIVKQLKAMDDVTVTPESLIYPQMQESMKKGLAVDGYGAIAYYHSETAFMYPEPKGTRTMMSPNSNNTPWANVLLANPVSVVNPEENITRTAKGLAYDITGGADNPIMTGKTFMDEYRHYADAVLGEERSLANQPQVDIWDAARKQNPDNPLEAVVSMNKKDLISNIDNTRVAVKELAQEMSDLTNQIDAIGLSNPTIVRGSPLGQVYAFKEPEAVANLKIEIRQIQRHLEKVKKGEQIIDIVTATDFSPAGAREFLTDDGIRTIDLGTFQEEYLPALTEAVALMDQEARIIAEDFLSQFKRFVQTSDNLNQAAKKIGKEGQDYVNAKWLQLSKLDENKIKEFEMIFEQTFQSGFRPYGVGSQGPQEITESMVDVVRWQAEGGLRKLLRTYDAVHNLVKGYLIGKTGFHSRNFFSAVFMNALAGVGNPKTYRRFTRAYWKSQYNYAVANGLDQYAAQLRKSAKKRGIWESISQVRPEDVAIIDQMRDGGILGGGQAGKVATEFETKAGPAQTALQKLNRLNPASGKNAFLQMHKNIGIGTETFVRGVLAFDTINKGGTIDDAFEQVIKYHFDYDDLSLFERGVIKRIYPFYVWTKRAFPLMLEEAFKQPKKFARVEHFKKEFTGYDESDPAPVPDYFTRQMGFETPFKYKDEKMWILPDLPHKVLPEMIDPFFQGGGNPLDRLEGGLSVMASGLSPLIKAQMERATNQNFWKGYSYSDRFMQVPRAFDVPVLRDVLQAAGIYKEANNGEMMVKDTDMNWLSSMIPILGDVRRLFPDEERYQQRVVSTVISYFLGIGLRTNTKYEQEKTLESRGYEEDEVQRMLRSLERESRRDN
tara:strand:+ start:3293 stop:14062 length:10770 start_codon:yes stop_codon:yes gene_type:complete